MNRLTFIGLCLFSGLNFATTNLGTINSVTNGFASVKDCEPLEVKLGAECGANSLPGLEGLLEFATTNQCLASEASFEDKGIELPACPSSDDQIKGLDHTYPTAGVFSLFTGSNASFLHNLASSYLENNKVGRFNVILPKSKVEDLKKYPELLKLLNSKQVNIIHVETMPAVQMWMQDSFEFTSINGKPALYQLEHMAEKGEQFKDRLACELARRCDIPYYIPPDMVDPKNSELHSINSGGNLEVLPGGSFYRGIAKTEGFEANQNEGKPLPFETKTQKKQRVSLEKSGNKVIDLDISFLSVGHVDEVINIVKTNQATPCHFAVLLASPQKAFEILEERAKYYDRPKSGSWNFQDFFFSQAFAGIKIETIKVSESQEETKLEAIVGNSKGNRCSHASYTTIQTLGAQKVLNKEDVDNIYKADCIDGAPVEEFVKSEEYQVLKSENYGSGNRPSIVKVMEENRKHLLKELKASTKCENPKVIEVPVFFRSGLSYTPDLVNGVVETIPGSPSNMMLPRTYFKPFDDYVDSALKEVGVNTTFIHDMEYHLLQGEVHCGTNSARVCKI